jgi:ribosomal protein S6
MSETETITRAYELGYLLVPTAAETEVPALIETLKAAITAAGGTIHSDGVPEFIDLAYTMEKSIASKKFKYSQGYFGWVKFEATPESVESLKKTLDGMTDVIRYLLVKTDLANMVVFRKPKIEAVREMASLDEEIVVEESAEDELKEDHELLPDLATDVAEIQVQAPVVEGTEEKEEA